MIRVLIVEDIMEYAEMLSQFLQNAGCETQVVDSVDAALVVAQEKQAIDIITLDINLGKGADDTIGRIREISASQPEALIIVISGVVNPDDTQKLIEAGAHGFIHKLEIPTLGKFGGRLSSLLGILSKSPPRLLHNIEHVELLAKHFTQWTQQFDKKP